MKSFFLILAAVLTLTAASVTPVSAQKTLNTDPFKFYLVGGAGLSSGLVTYALEPGLYSDNVWFGLPVEYTKVNDSTESIAVGLRYYQRLAQVGSQTHLFFYATPKVQVNDESLPFMFEPGAYVVTNLNSRLALWGAVSTTFYENTVPFSPFYLGGSAGLMVSF